ncbi:SDR family NAD(P)-dependent oxidoreductase [Mycolicibacterium mengxianglii]|uniref:SDR family NAD(P)-dependent oxidoreductase n=1 Tax=Mycolicibacterium mengxianglii TaxID=2736649 RepID=UPI0018EF02C7|nr:SDR family oxidoreductase [Mycolicibacterium mengxianglii]
MTTPRRYLITGGTSGIGDMCARHLTAEGHHVWVTGTREQSVAAAVDRGVAVGGSVCEAADADSVNQAFDDAVAALDGLDGVFLNAGIDGEGKPAEQLDPATFRRVLDVNVVGILNGAQAAHRTLDRPGAIVVNASVNAVRPETHFADYNASKAAAAALASTLAMEWSAEGLAVTCVCPGYFRSNMTAQYLDDPQIRRELLARIPAGRFGEAADIGTTVAFLLSNQAPFLTGALIPVAGASNL